MPRGVNSANIHSKCYLMNKSCYLSLGIIYKNVKYRYFPSVIDITGIVAHDTCMFHIYDCIHKTCI